MGQASTIYLVQFSQPWFSTGWIERCNFCGHTRECHEDPLLPLLTVRSWSGVSRNSQITSWLWVVQRVLQPLLSLHEQEGDT